MRLTKSRQRCEHDPLDTIANPSVTRSSSSSAVFRPAMPMFTSDDAVMPFSLRSSLQRVDAQLNELVYQTFPQAKAA
jgi:hypothetical protein